MLSLARVRTAAAAGLIATLAALAACGGNDRPADNGGSTPAPDTPTATPDANALVLPLEVLGDGSPRAPVVASARLTLAAADVAGIRTLWFRCHRCGFFGAPEFEATSQPVTRVKASVRVLGGAAAGDTVPWTDITDSTVTLADAERVQGGLSRGGLYTTRISLALDDATRARLVAGDNRVQFRFNGTDGESNGFRILDLQLRDASGASRATNVAQRADIAAEKAAGRTRTADVDAGETLWHGQGLLAKSSLVPRKMQAACASCHAEDGRDLQYFNYSNNAIVQRARFHGLTETQGRQIAAYLRYDQRDVPHVAAAAPWNPPYQPGPGLDAKPLAEWAAGAGLDAVLETPVQAVKALFGKADDGSALALTQADVDRVMDADATLNAREVAMPLQYPDWNAWLPTVHPMDVWPAGGATGSFDAGATFTNGRYDPAGASKRLDAWFVAHRNPNGRTGDWSHLTPAERNEVQSMLQMSGWEAYNYLGGGRGEHVAANGEFGAQVGARNLAARASTATTAAEPAAFTTNAYIERAVMSLLHWNVVRQWQLAQVHGLEGNQSWFIGDYDATNKTWKGRGEARGWPYNTVSLFFLAPHMLYQTDRDGTGKITREWVHAWETGNRVGSYYRTNGWYQMQVSVNPGAQSDWVNFSVDWPYLTGFDELLSSTVGRATPAQANAATLSDIRLLQARIKGAQFVNNAIPLYVATDTRSLILNRGRYSRAQTLKHFVPTNFIDIVTTQNASNTVFRQLDQLQPGLHLKVVNGAMHQFNQLFAVTDPAAWRRCDPSNMDLGEAEPTAGFGFCLDRTKQPLVALSSGGYAMNSVDYRQTAEQKQQYGLWKIGQMGGDTARLQTWQAWVNRAWP